MVNSEFSMQDHLLTLDEWAALAEDTSRWYELVDGVVVAAPRQGSNHQWVMGQLLAQLVAQLPPRLAVLYGMEVTVFEAFPPTVRVPDLVVVPEVLGRYESSLIPSWPCRTTER
ncbi:Uma2 family endonuclease [Kibdelosporangium lantanae]|uniref:Uma2 family endonuclease n=1 Tax=Kibdelosporangium lantanae TaxID=1497396 RepID=A0ABW3MLJ1_9PSEU